MFSFFVAHFHLKLFSFFQTVKYFNNEIYEADKYDEYLKSKLLTCSFAACSFINPENWIYQTGTLMYLSQQYMCVTSASTDEQEFVLIDVEP